MAALFQLQASDVKTQQAVEALYKAVLAHPHFQKYLQENIDAKRANPISSEQSHTFVYNTCFVVVRDGFTCISRRHDGSFHEHILDMINDIQNQQRKDSVEKKRGLCHIL